MERTPPLQHFPARKVTTLKISKLGQTRERLVDKTQTKQGPNLCCYFKTGGKIRHPNFHPL